MTTTQTDTQTCHACEDTTPSVEVRAQILDPDDDGEGRMIGWSRSQWFKLCAACLVEWSMDDQVALNEVSDL